MQSLLQHLQIFFQTLFGITWYFHLPDNSCSFPGGTPSLHPCPFMGTAFPLSPTCASWLKLASIGDRQWSLVVCSLCLPPQALIILAEWFIFDLSKESYGRLCRVWALDCCFLCLLGRCVLTDHIDRPLSWVPPAGAEVLSAARPALTLTQPLLTHSGSVLRRFSHSI